ncbi:MAG TPA: hypothetical protein VJL87_00955 [Bdellovibrionota bacterium]|nr:hypothetical protein [Bdellovibrionota bacterium]
MNPKSGNWTTEFVEFVSTPSIEPPTRISEDVFTHVKQALNPSPFKVFIKISLIHLIMGTLTLLFCPQFGVSPFKGIGLMAIFMHLGPIGCMISCGALFLGTSMLTASLILRPEEIKILRKGTIFHLLVLSLFSMAILICARAEIALGLGTAWLLGSTLGGTSTFEIGWMIRRSFIWR